MACSIRKDLGLLALRMGTGGVLIAHGSQKLFGWFGGYGLEATGKAMESMGFRPGKAAALAAGLGEAGGGLLLALGLATPAAGAAAAGAMAGAVTVHHKAGFFIQQGGYEYPAYLGLVAAALGIAGPGRLSLDELSRYRLDRTSVLICSFAASAVAAVAVIGRREDVMAAREQSAESE